MGNFTANDVQSLRKRTGAGMMDCKKALVEASGDVNRAVDILREKGIAKAAKKADRIAAQGLVFAKTEGELGVLVEVNSETDFVARNDKFKEFVCKVAETILKNKPKSLGDLQDCEIEGESGESVGSEINKLVASLGENLKVRRFVLMNGHLSTYIHGGGKIGVMVNFETDLAKKPEFLEYSRNIAMHIAASYTRYLDSSKVPLDVLEKERNIILKQQQELSSGKPEHIIQKIVDGKIGKFYEDFCLVNQKYVKDSDLTVAQYTEKVAKDLKGQIKILDFVRMELGEGLEQGSADFAKEVASMIN